MPSKTVPLSVRVSADDAEFLARLRIDEATTPSEKLRALLRNERRRREGYRDYRRVLALTRETFAPTQERIQAAESAAGTQSEVVHLMSDWLPDVIATVLTAVSEESPGTPEADLAALEAQLADRAFRLSEAILRLGVTREVRGCDPEVISRRVDTLVELVELVRLSQARASD